MASKLSNRDIFAAQEKLKTLGSLLTFPWHQQQIYALRAATDLIVVLGGNRSGKTTVGAGAVGWLARRDGPIYRRLQEPTGRTLKLWVAPQTDEKAKSVWEPLLLKWLDGLKPKYIQSPHRFFKIEDDLGGVEVWLKSQEQGFLSFESDDVDFVLFDEEPMDHRVYSSAVTRLATTNGCVMMTYTPLRGMTWTYDEIYSPVAENPAYQIADRVWRKGNEVTVVQQGMADNPLAVKGGGVYRIQTNAAMSQSEKDARLYGLYGYTEGLLLPQFAGLKTDSVSPYLLNALPAGRAYRWILTADPNKRHGALLTAVDHEENRYYAAEHYAEGIPDSEHARAYRMMLRQYHLQDRDVEVFADPGGAGSQAIINLGEVGFFAAPVPKGPGSVGASIKRWRRAAHIDPSHRHPVTGEKGAPHCYFLRSLESTWRSGGKIYHESRLLWELRQYRQRENAAPDTPIKQHDDLVDCGRYVELARMLPAEEAPDDELQKQRARLDAVSRHEAEQFDRMLQQLERQTPMSLLT